MKRFTRSESLDTLIPTHHQPKEEDEKNNTRDNGGYSKDFQAKLDSYDQEDSGEEVSVKKRRLSLHQVKTLEISFEVENKLEPERKVKLAEETGLEPRQVAIWFQNRRARWKTKQLEKDYSLMKAEYDALKDNYDGLEKQNKVLAEKLKELKAKMCRDNAESDQCVKEESPISVYKSNVMEKSREQEMSDNGDEAGLDMISKDGSSNSEESNGAMKEEESNENYESSMVYNGASLSSNSMMNWFQVSDSSSGNKGYHHHHHHHHHQSQLVRMEEQNLFSTEESCNFFSVDQAPSLHW